jgi:hypothetical protein
MPGYVIRPHDSRRQRFVWMGVLAAFVVLGLVAYDYGRRTGGLDGMSRGETLSTLQSRMADQQSQIAALRERAAELERGEQMAQRALQDLKQVLDRRDTEIASLREDLVFYQNVVAPGSASASLAVNKLTVKTKEEGLYHFRLVLTHLAKQDAMIEGTAEINVSGGMDGQVKDIGGAELMGEGKPALAFKFKLFQRLEGALRLPPGFTPRSVVVKLNPRGGAPVTRRLEWGDIVES